MIDSKNVVGIIDENLYPKEQRELVREFNKKLIEINENNSQLAMTVSRKEQRRYTSTSDVIQVYNINLTLGMIEDEIYERRNDQEYPVLKALGLSAPCALEDFIKANNEQLVNEEYRNDFAEYFSQQRLYECYIEGELRQTLDYAVTYGGQEHMIRSTILLTKETSLNHIIAMCSSKDISQQVNSERQLLEAYTAIDQSLGIIEGLTKEYHTIWLVDPQTHLMQLFSTAGGDSSDEAIMQVLGLTYEEAVNVYSDRHIAEKDRERVKKEAALENMLPFLANDNMFRINYLRKGSLGKDTYSQMTFARTNLSAGGYTYILAFRDVDELIKQEIASTAQEERLKQYESDAKSMELIHDAIGSGSWNIDFNEHGAINKVTWSHTFRDMLGYESMDSFPDELESWTDLLHGDDREKVIEAFWEAINDSTGEKQFEESFRLYTVNQGIKWFKAVGRISRRQDGSPLTFIGLFFDIDEQKKSEKALVEQMQIVEALSRDYLNIYRVNMRERSAQTIKIEGYNIKGLDARSNKKYAYDALVRQYIKERVYKDDREELLKLMNLDKVREELAESDEYVHGYRVYEDGKIHYYQFKYFMLKEDGIVDRNKVIAGFKNVDSVVEAAMERQSLIIQAETDLMTGILNRGSGEQKTIDAIEAGKGGMLVVLDVDNFKSFNDTYGHSAGDKVIKAVADCLSEAFGDDDIVFRLGGDEFAVYAPGVDSEDAGSRLLGGYIDRIAAINIPEICGQTISSSIGAVIVPDKCEERFESLYKKADICVYEGKKKSGTVLTFYKKA